MSIKRFFGATTRDALRMVRDALGPDGVILSNRSVDGGVEILALGAEDITALVPQAGEAAAKGAVDRTRLDESRNDAEPEQPGSRVPGQKSAKASVYRAVKMEETAQSRKISPFMAPPAEQGGRNKQEESEEEWLEEEAGSNPVAAHSLPRFKFPAFDKQQQRPPRSPVSNIPTFATGADAARQPLAPAAGNTQRMPENVSAATLPAFGAGKNVAASMVDTASGNGALRQPENGDEPAIPGPREENIRDHEVEAGPRKRRATATVRKAVKSQAREQGAVSEATGQPAFDSRQVADQVAASVLSEIRSMRGTLEHQLATLTWTERQRRDPSRGHVLGQLLAAGFSAALAHELLERLPAGLEERKAMEWIKTVLKANLQTIANENEILEQGGVYALVGPTGVGKTTTTAKLAARCVVRHGADKLALLTTDGYRIGGHEQLRIYGKILGVTVYAVKDQQDLSLALLELRGKHMVLIDTVGMSQRDRMVAEQVAMLSGCGTDVKRLLLLNASSSGDTLNEVVSAYEGGGLAGTIITKLDEAATTGGVLDTVIRHQLKLYYTATGQRVPEDLHIGNADHLVGDAFDNLPAASPFAMPENAFPLLMREGTGRMAGLGMNGGCLG
ncbi:MAG: flagellar biosynthesis protein FlhF [Nitrosospira sp. 56-18]|nr:flagellar biosynthesis protein FlhF [Nitrosospira sp.]OJY15410.1 MAG: flagellar biosynthesis protein FlhF [Nitrosospira sp. 56-18]